MKHLQRVLFLLIFTALFLNASETTKERVTLELAWKHQFQFAGYYMAKEKGYYSEANLDVEINEHNSTDVINEVLTNEATYGIGQSSLIVDIANGKKVKMLSAIFQSSPSVFIALKDSNITKLEDFVDKKVMVTEDMAIAVSLQALLKKNGLSISDIKMKKHSYSIDTLIDAEVDIAVGYISNEPFLLQERGKEFVVFNAMDEGFDFYSDILYTSSKELLLHKERALAFNAASIKGWEYAFSHMQETVELILKKYNTQNKSKEALLYEAKALKKLAYSSNIPLGSITLSKLQRIYDIYNVMGFISSNVALKELYSSSKKKLLTSEEENYLQKKKFIKVCVDPDWMPYEKIEDGQHIGMSADYFVLFEKMLKTRIEVVETQNWNESLEFAKERKCDLLSFATRTQSREEYLTFTQPYMDLVLVMATRLGVPFINDFKHLQGKRIGVSKSFAFIETIQKEYPNLILVEVKNSEEGLSKVRDSILFGYIGSLADIGYLFQKEFIGELKISGKFEKNWQHSIAVRNDDAMLLQIFNKVLENISFEERKKIENKWISIQYDEQKDDTLMKWSLGFAFFGLSILFMMYIRQRDISKIMKEQAARDYMTKLYNRRYFADSSEHILDLARRNLTDISIVMLDIDNFKHVNDTYGHKAGDETIIALSKIMLDETRKSDMVARWGGEEFVILFPETDLLGASTIAQKIRVKMQKLEFITEKFQTYSVTISLGVSNVNVETEISLEAAIMRADKALYEAKQSGKNRVCVNADEF